MKKRKEKFKNLLVYKNIKINKITSPKEFRSAEFIQKEDEFVYLLKGKAKLKIGKKTLYIKSGETLFIEANKKHKILKTSKKKKTIWLTIHIH